MKISYVTLIHKMNALSQLTHDLAKEVDIRFWPAIGKVTLLGSGEGQCLFVPWHAPLSVTTVRVRVGRPGRDQRLV